MSESSFFKSQLCEDSVTGSFYRYSQSAGLYGAYAQADESSRKEQDHTCVHLAQYEHPGEKRKEGGDHNKAVPLAIEQTSGKL